jgi:asparagine synthase (glutamine-hydrolysing)
LTVDSRSDVLPRVAAERLRQRVRDLDAVTAQSLCEAAFYMSDMLLRDGDQMAMAHALEVRFPLLDREWTGAALAIPGKRKLAPGKRGPLKGLLLDACPIALPTEAVHRKKMGFVLPYAQWLRGPLRHWASEALLDDKLWSGLAMHAEAVADVWRQFLAEKPSVRPSDVLALVHLGCWARLHRVAAE